MPSAAQPYDVLIIGAGISGAMIARELARYDLRLAVLERGNDVACGSTKANAGVIHPGYHPRPGSLMARLNVEGNRLYPGLAAELGVDLHRPGSLMAALDESDLAVLERHLAQARRNGVPGAAILTRAEALRLEPGLNPKIVAALHEPTAATIDPCQMAVACAENAAENGVAFRFGTEAKGIRPAGPDLLELQTDGGAWLARRVINAAGLGADEIAASSGDGSFRLRPRKGEVIILDRKLGWLAQRVIYPVPVPESKGILVVPAVEGNTLLGSTAENVEDRTDLRTGERGRAELLAGATRLFPDREVERHVIAHFAGVRAVAESDDFVIQPSPGIQGLLHVAGIQSPGLASAPAVARLAVEIMREDGLDLRPRPDFHPEQRRPVRLAGLALPEIAALVAEDRLYGRVVCRCERVSEAEIVAAIRRPLGARTLDGLKKRTRAQTGRCQGGYCSCHLLAILARELGVPLDQITKDGPGAAMLAGPAKSLLLATLREGRSPER